MSEEAPVKRKGKALKWILYFTPIYPLMRTAGALTRARETVVKAIKKGNDNLSSSTPEGKYPEDDVRSIQNAEQRFQAMYELHEWSECELHMQKLACQRTKLASFSIAIVGFISVLGLILAMPYWTMMFILPVGGCVVILGLAQGFKFALYQAQIDLKSLIGARDFLAREDFFVRLIG